MNKLFGVPGDVIDSVWPDIEPFVTKCLVKVEEYRWLPEDVRELIRGNDVQLWLCLAGTALQGIIVTELSRTPRALTCEIFLVSGERPDGWEDYINQLEEWAKGQGCTHVATLARPGAAKIMGYSKSMIRVFRRL